jgi:hypothetical protein
MAKLSGCANDSGTHLITRQKGSGSPRIGCGPTIALAQFGQAGEEA